MCNDLRERALRLLARRDYARQELSRKLAPHAESAQQLAALLDDLAAGSLLSDQRYAATRISSRGARVGDARLAYELRGKGVAEDVVSAALAGVEDELTRARRVWQRKFAGGAPAAGDAAERARQARFLAGRGFSADTIRRVLRGHLDDD
ncbi:MAG: recombination regulator RecX [Candidatus Accumulibacter phosphatis]|uniref:recombination regulator RecX n=1 Tax=Candidatus Accumulibacter phosphatis TaxID=327160 RepID=UPI001A56FE6D|nr:recombination regulator RecX [Candidatus Accumulibacter phosphatis]